jgi:hypothetical protein
LLASDTNGIAQMFRMIEHARMLVGTKAIATLFDGYSTPWSTPRLGSRG